MRFSKSLFITGLASSVFVKGQSSSSDSSVSSASPDASSVSSASPASSSSANSTATVQGPAGGKSSAIPSPTALSPEWRSAYAKAKAAVAKLSLQDKVDLATGIGWQNGPCVGNTPNVTKINYPGLCLQDSPLGVRFADLVTAFPAAVNVASTFNRTLMRQRGQAMGSEHHAKGVNVALGPMMNIARTPAAGRNWEGFGADPYLSGEGAYETVMGIQSAGVQATAKHYINNEQEHFRETSSSNVADRTEMEIYALPFLRAVQANTASVMCSYNQVNGTYACENDRTLNNILKGKFSFPGYVMSDWWATHSTSPAVNGGLDMTMPGDKTLGSGDSWFGPNLVAAVNNGSVSEARMTDVATRILAAWYLLGQDKGYPAPNFDSWDPSKGQHINVQDDHKNLVRTIDAASTVLLKNNNNSLPLKKPASLGVIGSGARNNSAGDPNACSDRQCNDGVLAMGWGSGTAEFPYLISPATAIIAQAAKDGTTVVSSYSDTDLAAASVAAAGKDAALVFITADSGEAYLTVEGNAGDRNNLSAWHGGDALVSAVAGSNRNTVVVVNSVGAIDMESWIEHPNVTAVVWSGLPGQEAGNGLVDILYGAYNPSGRLPYTIARSANDYSAQVIYTGTGTVQIPYTENLLVDYRSFDAKNIQPRFEFGFGLSYTKFKYSGLTVFGFPITSGGSSTDARLHQKVITVKFNIANTGSVDGHEVPQLYVTLPRSTNSPPKSLKGFDSVFVPAGGRVGVTMQLSSFDFATWDTKSQSWKVAFGGAKINIGASSRDIRLTKTILI